MAQVLEDSIPPHIRRNIESTLSGRRDVFKPPPRKQAPSISISLTPADLGFEPGLLSATGNTSNSFYGEPSGRGPSYGASWNGPGSGTGPAASTLSSSDRIPPSLDQLLESSPSGPGVLCAARRVGQAWARQQHREWYQGQLAKRAERVDSEAERLFLTAIGPLGMSLDIWRRVSDKVEGVARRNVMRGEAVELQRLRLEEWNPQLLSRSGAAAVRNAIAAARGAASAASSAAAGGGGSLSPKGVGGGPAAGSFGGSPSLQGRRCMSALPHRYMETDVERTRIRRALDQLAAKHAATAAEVQAPPPDVAPSSGTLPNPSACASPPPAAAAAAAAGRGGRLRGSPGDEAAAAAAAADAAEGPSSSASKSPLQLLQGLRARREARWVRETAAMASRVAQFMEAESPASPRLTLAAASCKAGAHARDALRPAGQSRQSRSPAAASGSGISVGGAPGPGSGSAVGTWGAGSGGPQPQPQPQPHVSGSGCVSGSGRVTLSPPGSPRRAQQLLQLQQEEEELVRLPPDKAALAVQLVEAYRSSCSHYRLHPEQAVCSALRRSCAPVQGEPRAHLLELVALTLTNRESAAALAGVLMVCKHLTAVTLDRCAVCLEAMGELLPALWGLHLRRLTTSNTEFPQAAWPLLQRALGRPTVWASEATWWLSLRQLSLAGNGLADQGLCALAEVLVAMPNLQSLALRQVGLSDLSAPRLEELLGRVTALRELDLGYNNLGGRAVGALARGLPKAKELRRLSLPWNSVGGGVAALCWTVLRLGPRHCRLEGLDLAGTDLVAEDLFALAAVLRSQHLRAPITSVRHIDLSHNNLVGVAGQCLLRHLNILMQPQPPEAAAVAAEDQRNGKDTGQPAASAVAAEATEAGLGLVPGSPVGAPAAAPPPGGPPAAASFRSAAAADGGGSGGVVGAGAGGGGGKVLVPILKIPGAGGRTAPDSPVKRLTINPKPQSAASAPPSSSSSATAPQENPFVARSLSASTSYNIAAAVMEATADRTIAAVAARAVAATAGVCGGSAASPGSSFSICVITTGCVVQPCLPPGVKLLVRADGWPVAGNGGSDDDDGDSGRYGGADERDRQLQRERERERERARAREQEWDRERRLGEQRSQQQSQLHSGSGSGGAAAAAAAAAAVAGGGGSSRFNPQRHQSQQSSGGASAWAKTGPAGRGGGQGRGPVEQEEMQEETVEPLYGAASLHPHYVLLDLSLDLPDRATAALLMEHELEARRHGYRSAFLGVKWRGELFKQEGVDVGPDPLDPLFRGWSHELPREGRLELLVAALPPQLCPWLANTALHCNHTTS